MDRTIGRVCEGLLWLLGKPQEQVVQELLAGRREPAEEEPARPHPAS
jgi:hypothetical protein